jgi:hypothetical protein
MGEVKKGVGNVKSRRESGVKMALREEGEEGGGEGLKVGGK